MGLAVALVVLALIGAMVVGKWIADAAERWLGGMGTEVSEEQERLIRYALDDMKEPPQSAGLTEAEAIRLATYF